MKNRSTSDNITRVSRNQVFIFGSNESGFHGAGAARMAMNFGAKIGQAEGLQGLTYAIPTKDKSIELQLTLEEISRYVDRFIEFSKQNPELTFLVTEIGCGLAGYTPEQVAPLFTKAVNVENIHLPHRFWEQLV